MAIGESRHAAKQAARQAANQPSWSVPTEKMYSHGTRNVYQQHLLAFVNWARTQVGIRRFAVVQERSDALATRYLTEQITAQKSPYTLQTQRSALRKVFGDPQLAATVVLPRRTREGITRSRRSVTRDHDFQPTNWQPLICFAAATGLRRSELRDLRVGDVQRAAHGALLVTVCNGKGGKARDVPVLVHDEPAVLAVVDGRDPAEHVFARIPAHLDVHSYRRAFAQARYLYHAPGCALPSMEGRLKSTDYDAVAVQQVSWALGHNRREVALTHYLR